MRRRPSLLLALFLTIVVALAAVSSALAGNGGLAPPAADSPNAQRINDAYFVIAIFTGIILVGVETALIVFIVRFRRGRRARTAEGPQIHGSTRLELIWTVIPVVVLAAIGAFVFYKLPGIKNVPPANAAGKNITVRIEGHQFYWLFRYPNGAIAIDRLRAPAHRVVREEVTAPEDGVLHSWWVPRLGGKTDAIPGHVSVTWFSAPVGRYEYRCGELCGIQHAYMNGHVSVLPQSDFDRFVNHRAANPRGADFGKEEWIGACTKCHRLATEYVGPALGGNPLLADRRGMETLLRNGQGQMPAVGANWTDAQIDALIAYTKRFAGSSGGGSTGGSNGG